jgi:hypothetical protein
MWVVLRPDARGRESLAHFVNDAVHSVTMGRADIALRHVTHQYPEDLARALLPPGLAFEVAGWFDSQLTMLERRLDEALDLRVAGERRLLHVEIELDLEDEDAARVDAYRALLLTALRLEASTAPRAPRPPPKPRVPNGPAKPRARVPVHSVVIVLRGRKEPWSEEGEYGTDWPELPWSGTRFRVEAVYQRTVAELRARGGLLWHVFAPLAVDASAAVMREVLDEIRGRTAPDEVRAALYTALLVMAEVDPWGHNLAKEITAMMQADDLEIFKLSPTLRKAFDEGKQEGELRGAESERRELLSEAFAEQTGRAPTPDEQVALARRAEEVGAKQALRALFKLHGEALVAWVLGSGAPPRASGE